MKRFVGIAAAVLALAAFSACSGKNSGTVIQRDSSSQRTTRTPAPAPVPVAPAPVAAAPVAQPVQTLNLKFAHNQTSLDNPYSYGAIAFKEKIEQISNGAVRVELFHGSMDENESGLFEKLQSGEASIVVVSPSYITALNVPEIDVFSLEYLFDSFDHWGKVLDGQFGRELSDLAMQKTSNRFKILGYWSAGVRDYYGKKPIYKPADLSGMTIRISSSPVQQQFFIACGATPKAVGWGDLYQALQDDLVDSAENDYTNFSLKEHHKTKNGHYVCETNHDFTTRFMLIDGRFYNSLTAEQRRWIDEASKYATQVEREKTFAQLADSKAQVIKDGAEVIEKSAIDIAAFQAIAYPIQDQYAKENSMERFIKMVRDAK